MQETVLRVAEAFAVYEAAKKVFENIKGSIESISQMKILAERVGMSSEAFGQLAYSSRKAHLDSDTLAISLEQMSKRLGEVAIEGQGPAADALKRFGLNARQLTMMGTEGALSKILTVMEGIKNPMERAAVATDLFGKSGQAMINIVAMGGEELKHNAEEASRLGVALNAIDTARVEEADQAFIQLNEATTGFYNLVAVQVAPVITALIDSYLEWGYSGVKSASFVSQGMNWVVKGIGLATDALNVFRTVWYGLQTTVTGVIAAVLDSLVILNDTFGNIGANFQKAFNLVGLPQLASLKDTAEAMHKLADAQGIAAMSAASQVGHGQEIARNLVDDFEKRANARAGIAAAKGAAFMKPGALSAGKEEYTKTGGGLELGSKEAYSSILRARGISGGGDQKKIADNTAKLSELGQQQVGLLARIAGAGPKPGGKLMLDLPGAN